MEDLKQAMREGDEQRRSVLRLARAAIKNAEIAQGRQLDDEGVLAVLAKEAKQRRESIEEYRKAHREDLANAEQAELGILLSYLPQQLTPEELREIVKRTIDEVGATGSKDIGKVMPAVMARVKGRADGRVVNPLVREELESRAAGG
ncbi:MAG: GatB/YqeY domain-containing protein [Chloroflexi bacterium]|nr:GatB/YqeY domain-containing protein [Chloroflexota bacterium]